MSRSAPTASAPGGNSNFAGDVTIKSGAVIDLDGGWVTLPGRMVQTNGTDRRVGQRR